MSILNLHSYDVVFTQKLLDDSYSEIIVDYEARSAVVTLSSVFEELDIGETKESMLRTTALHEALHLLLGEINFHAENRMWNQEIFTSACHATINRLIPVLIEKEGKPNISA